MLNLCWLCVGPFGILIGPDKCLPVSRSSPVSHSLRIYLSVYLSICLCVSFSWYLLLCLPSCPSETCLFAPLYVIWHLLHIGWTSFDIVMSWRWLNIKSKIFLWHWGQRRLDIIPTSQRCISIVCFLMISKHRFTIADPVIEFALHLSSPSIDMEWLNTRFLHDIPHIILIWYWIEGSCENGHSWKTTLKLFPWLFFTTNSLP